ncbi:MAG: phage tail protein [Chitinophagaceae bacterium]|nr:phage tail protein [Chitinophagaceae bacterium]
MAEEDQFLGEIRLFGGTNAPTGWAFCNGQLLDIGENAALFSVIGTTYGGDGNSTFGLPDLRGRVPIHLSNSYPLGQSGGLETVGLLPDNLPAHSHAVTASTQGGSDSPKGNAWGLATVNVYAGSSATNLAMSTDGITTAGSGETHDNMVPFLVVGYIIALVGIYPSKPEEE